MPAGGRQGRTAGPSRALAAGTHSRISSSPEREVSQIKKAKEPQVKRMNMNLPLELHNSFKSITASQGENMTDVLLGFIQNYIARYAAPTSKQKAGASEARRPYEGLDRRSASQDPTLRPPPDGCPAEVAESV